MRSQLQLITLEDLDLHLKRASVAKEHTKCDSIQPESRVSHVSVTLLLGSTTSSIPYAQLQALVRC